MNRDTSRLKHFTNQWNSNIFGKLPHVNNHDIWSFFDVGLHHPLMASAQVVSCDFTNQKFCAKKTSLPAVFLGLGKYQKLGKNRWCQFLHILTYQNHSIQHVNNLKVFFGHFPRISQCTSFVVGSIPHILENNQKNVAWLGTIPLMPSTSRSSEVALWFPWIPNLERFQKWIPMDTLQGTRKHIPPKGKRKIIDSKASLGRDMLVSRRVCKHVLKGLQFCDHLVKNDVILVVVTFTVRGSFVSFRFHQRHVYVCLFPTLCINHDKCLRVLVVNNIRSWNHSNNNTRQEIGVWSWNPFFPPMYQNHLQY